MTARGTLLLVTAVLVLGGCGASHVQGATMPYSSSPDAWNVDVLPDPCRVATPAELSRVLGAPVGTGSRLKSWPPLCRFVLDGPSETSVYLSDNSQPSGRTDFDSRANGTTTPVTGVGDRAYWQADTTTLHVLSGPTHVVITFRGPKTPAGAEAKAAALAVLILPRTGPSP